MTKARLRLVAVSALLGAVCAALVGPVAGSADEAADALGPRRMEGVWLASDSTAKGWRYITRYEISVTGNRFLAAGALYIVSPRGLTQSQPPTVNELAGTIDGTVLSGEVSIYRGSPRQDGIRGSPRQDGITTTRPLRGSVDFERGVISIQYKGPAPDDTPGDETEKWRDGDRTLTLRALGKKSRRQE